jgi:hypothetical protein
MALMPDRIILPEQVQVLRLRDRDPSPPPAATEFPFSASMARQTS